MKAYILEIENHPEKRQILLQRLVQQLLYIETGYNLVWNIATSYNLNVGVEDVDWTLEVWGHSNKIILDIVSQCTQDFIDVSTFPYLTKFVERKVDKLHIKGQIINSGKNYYWPVTIVQAYHSLSTFANIFIEKLGKRLEKVFKGGKLPPYNSRETFTAYLANNVEYQHNLEILKKRNATHFIEPAMEIIASVFDN